MSASIHVLAFDYRNATIALMRTTKYNHTESVMKVAIAMQDDRNVVREGIMMILLHGRYHCSSVRQLKAASRHEWTERSPHFTQVICRDGHSIENADVIKLL